MDQLNPDTLFVIHGFLSLPNRAKMQVVEAMNEYFDSGEKEKVRARYDESFAELTTAGAKIDCVCCGGKI